MAARRPSGRHASCSTGALSALDLHHAVERLTAPTVVIAGERDKLTPPGHAERLVAVLPHVVEHVVLPGSGHMTPVFDADAVTARIAALARDHASQPAPRAG